MKYILFDLDGTLINTGEGVVKSVYYALDALGVTEDEPDKLKRFVGPPLQYSFKEYYQLNDRGVERAIAKYRERYTVKGIYECEPFEGIPELLDALIANGKILCIATSKPMHFAKQILENFKLYDKFDFVSAATMDSSMIEKPDIIRNVIRHYGEDEKSEMLMVGDTKFDIIGARQCGIKNIGVRYGFAAKGELEAENPDLIVETVADLKSALLEDNI